MQIDFTIMDDTSPEGSEKIPKRKEIIPNYGQELKPTMQNTYQAHDY